MTDAVVLDALTLWDCDGTTAELIAARENRVFAVDGPRGRSVLRLHRPGYRSDAQLRSELDWMQAMAKAGLTVPSPIPARDGALLHDVSGVQVDMVSWLDGTPIGQTGNPPVPDLLRSIGVLTARLHSASDAWQVPAGFERPAWDLAGLIGPDPLWGRFWENPTLDSAQKTLFETARDAAMQDLTAVQDSLDYGLVHADLLGENILVAHDGRLGIIDFDDGGWGFRLFDLATTLLKVAGPDNATLRDALLDGYHSIRPLDAAALDLFVLLRALSYVGWIVPRLSEPQARARNERSTRAAARLARDYLAAR